MLTSHTSIWARVFDHCYVWRQNNYVNMTFFVFLSNFMAKTL